MLLMAVNFGLIGDKEGSHVPLESISIAGQVKGYVAGVDLNLCYRNSSDDPLEVSFRFPVEEATAVVGLEAKVDGRTIKGVVREKEEARATYDDAIASGLTAALGEEKTGDIFSLSLGNLPPKAEAELLLRVVTELPIESEVGAARLSLPAVLKPRYAPAGSSNVAPSLLGWLRGIGSYSAACAPTIGHFLIKVEGADKVDSVTSPTHDINIGEGEGCREVTLRDQGRYLASDFVLLVSYQEPNTPRATVEEGVEGDNELLCNPAVMLDFWPKFDDPRSVCEFVFVVDRSGSMQGAFMESAKQVLLLFLRSIPMNCYFNIVGFGSTFCYFSEKSVKYNQRNLDRSVKYVEKMSADLLGTDMLPPLMFVFRQRLIPGHPRQVFVLTDGSVSNTKECIDLVTENAHTARVFTFGIGSGASSALVNGLARAGNGSAEFVKEGERMEPKVIGSLKKALQPVMTDIVLTVTAPEGVEVLQVPSQVFPPLLNNHKTVAYLLLKGQCPKNGAYRATLEGKLLEAPFQYCIDFSVTSNQLVSQFPTVIHSLLAKKLIQEWELGAGTMKGVAIEEREAAIVKLSVESSVISSLTAYVAVDETQERAIAGAMKVWDLSALPVCTPRWQLPRFGAAKRHCQTPHLPKAKKLKKSVAKKGAAKPKKKAAAKRKSVRAPTASSSSSSTVTTVLCSKASEPCSHRDVVMLQSAEGYWRLDKALAVHIGHALPDLRSSCPAGCSEWAWATVLAVVWLEERHPLLRDEWELIVAKAEMWLQSQLLTVNSLKDQAKTVLQSI